MCGRTWCARGASWAWPTWTRRSPGSRNVTTSRWCCTASSLNPTPRRDDTPLVELLARKYRDVGRADAVEPAAPRSTWAPSGASTSASTTPSGQHLRRPPPHPPGGRPRLARAMEDRLGTSYFTEGKAIGDPGGAPGRGDRGGPAGRRGRRGARRRPLRGCRRHRRRGREAHRHRRRPVLRLRRPVRRERRPTRRRACATPSTRPGPSASPRSPWSVPPTPRPTAMPAAPTAARSRPAASHGTDGPSLVLVRNVAVGRPTSRPERPRRPVQVR